MIGDETEPPGVPISRGHVDAVPFPEWGPPMSLSKMKRFLGKIDFMLDQSIFR
jgi:hypothetical protein